MVDKKKIDYTLLPDSEFIKYKIKYDADLWSKEAHRRKMAKVNARPFYNLNSIMGYMNTQKNCRFCILLGGRQAGKSYSVMHYAIKQFIKYGVSCYWVRLNEASTKKLLSNNAEKLVDPDLRRKYHLTLRTIGNSVYSVKLDKDGNIIKGSKKLFCIVMALSTFYADKGNGYYDKDYLQLNPKNKYIICLDEFQKEKTEKSQGDVCYQFVNQMENILRNTKERIKIFLIANAVQECSDIMAGCFNFIPEKFGRYYLARKHAIIDYMQPTEAYKEMRKGSIADILMPEASTFTNEIKIDTSLVYKGRLTTPQSIIKFSKDKTKWFTLWNNGVIARYNGERKNSVVAMRPYIDEFYDVELRDNIINIFDTRSFKYKNLITFKIFQMEIQQLKPRK